MAKKGEFYPWRVKYSYPNGVSDVEYRISDEDHALRKAAELLWRGADIEILTVDPDTKAHTLKYTVRATDFDFSVLDKDRAEATVHELAYDMLYEYLFGEPSRDAVIRAELAEKDEAEAREALRQVPDWMKRPGGKPDNSDLPVVKEALPEPEETRRARLALNKEIAAEHQAVAQALSDKGLLKHPCVSEEKPMDLVWIITRPDDECGYSVIDSDDLITATIEDAREAFIDAVRRTPGSFKDYTIPVEAIPAEPDHGVSWGKHEGDRDVVLTCRRVSSGLRTARLRARQAELQQELERVNQELSDTEQEA